MKKNSIEVPLQYKLLWGVVALCDANLGLALFAALLLRISHILYLAMLGLIEREPRCHDSEGERRLHTALSRGIMM